VGKLWEGAGGRERGKERDIGVAGAAARALLLLLVLDGREAPIKTITNRPTGHRLGTTGTGATKIRSLLRPHPSLPYQEQ
jgi:hypothetical protein